MDRRSLSISSKRTRGLWALLVIGINLLFLTLLRPTFGLASSESTGGGVIWGTPKFVSTTAYNGAFIPVLKADSNGRLLMVYNQDTASGDTSIENPYYRASSDRGHTWSQPAPIHISGLRLLQATIDFDNQNKAHAIWRTNTELWHAREGQWPNGANLITSTLNLDVRDPDMTVDANGVIHVVWAQENASSSWIYYSRSEDGGNNWSSAAAVSESGNYPESPAIVLDDDGNVHVVWDERVYYDCPPLCTKVYEVRYRTGMPEAQGINWSGPSELLSEGLVKAVQPDIVIHGGQIHVVFARRDGIEPDVEQYAYYTFKGPGMDWSDPIDISHEPVTVHFNLPMYLDPALVPCENTLYVYFHGAPTKVSNEVIVNAVSTDGWTQTYSAEVGNARAIRPSVVCQGGKMHMVYERVIYPNTDHQIYYMSGNRFAISLPLVAK